uniref:Uncharacterized protein n=1 Tax=Kalanchoe fedtschenkoi TaxID=63787 RepID=A0A7N0TN29_KALFE
MGNKKCDAAQITLDALRIALQWAQNAKVFKSRLMQHIRHACHHLRILKTSSKAYVHHGEHEFSFDSTPMIHVKMYRPHSMKFKMPTLSLPSGGNMVPYDRGIDARAEEFITRFYNQIKLQRSDLILPT